MSEREYPVRRPAAAFLAGAAVALLGGLIGLGGAEFRLPLLIAVFDLFPHRAVRANLLISLATLAVSAVARLALTEAPGLGGLAWEMAGMLAGGVAAAWIGAGFLRRIPRSGLMATIAVLLAGIAGLLVLETVLSGMAGPVLPADPALRLAAALAAGLMVGAVSSLLGVAGGELIIPILIFLFGADIRTAGTASVLISIPVVLTGIARHWLTGHYRSRSLFSRLVLPMCLGSVAGAIAGAWLAAWTPTDALRLALAAILAVSAVKLWRDGAAH